MALLKSITKSKIVCTLGPTTNTSEHILKLAEIGMDCTRINFSHGSAQDKIDLFKLVRETDDHLAILCDIQGPKIRIGMVKEGGVLLRSGDSIIVTTDDVTGDEQKITITYPGLELEIKVGELIYINDGIVCLKVTSITGKDIHCDILAGGNISSRKGVNLPSSELSQKVPTEKDVIDLTTVRGDQEAFQFASEIKQFLESENYNVNGVNQADFSNPVKGQSIEPRKEGGIKIIIGGA